MYKFFPRTTLQVDELGNTIKLIDITKTVRLKNYVKSLRMVFGKPYRINNGDRPDVVANMLYENPRYEYILLLLNDIESIYDQWPKNSIDLKNYIIEKYGSIAASNQYRTFHTEAGDIVSEEYWETIPGFKKYRETFYEYEQRRNLEKSFIKVIDLPLVVKFETDIQELLRT